MAFQIKDFRSIVASMINVAKASQRQLTDFSVGSVGRTLMESPAVEIEELYLQMMLGLQDAIPVAIYQAFNFPVIGALPAGGLVTLHFPSALESPVMVPVGTPFIAAGSGQSYLCTTSVEIPAGATQALATVVAASPGAAGNIGPNEITYIGSDLEFPSGTTYSHPLFTSGRDSETELVRKTRFIQFVLSLSRGTVQAVKYCASLATVKDGAGAVQEYVERSGMIEERGYVQIFLRGSSGVPSAELIANAQKLIDGYTENGSAVAGYRAAGVEVVVGAMSERAIPVSVSVATGSGVLQSASLASSITAAIGVVVRGVASGEYLRADALVTAVLGVPGVIAASFSGGENTLCAESETLIPGVVSITWLQNA